MKAVRIMTYGFLLSGWQCGWAFVLLAVILSLIAMIIYYFCYVFSTAVYSRVLIESPGNKGIKLVQNLPHI